MKSIKTELNTKQILMKLIVTDMYGTHNLHKGAVQNTRRQNYYSHKSTNIKGTRNTLTLRTLKRKTKINDCD